MGSTSSTSPSPQAPAAVPLIDIGRQHLPLEREMLASLHQVLTSGQFILGPQCERLEHELAAYSQTAYGIGCASGSDALLLALMAIDLAPGDEVILPSYTFFATASAVWRLGATPVFADIRPLDFNIDPAAVESLVTPRTKAIMPVHLYGQCADMDALSAIARKHHLAVIEDAAQAIGAEYRGRRAGSLGEIGCLSFYPTKNLGGCGDGGLLLTSRADLADKLKLLRGHGMQPRYYHKVVGINSRLDAFQAALLRVKLPHLEAWTAARQANAARYTLLFNECGLDAEIGLPLAAAHCRHVWNQYVVRVPGVRRDALREHLKQAHIGTEIYYPVPLHQQECFEGLGYATGSLPESERAAQETLALPIFPEMTGEEQIRVVEQIATFFKPPVMGHKLKGPKYLTTPTSQRHNA
jgi:dTDP-4-amino-4,6-dideoxygalactose transaminase